MDVTKKVAGQSPGVSPRGAGASRRLRALLGSRLLRAAVSLLLLGLLLTRIDLDLLGDTLQGVAPGLLALGVFTFLVCNMVNIFKWQLIIKAQGTQTPYFYLTSLYYIGLFFNNFLPSNIGGDVVKAWKLAKLTGRSAESAGSVVLDRASSTLAILMLAVPPALLELRLLGPGLAVAVVTMFIIAILAIAFLASEKAVLWLGRFPGLRSDPFGLRRHVRDFYYSLYSFRDRRRTLVYVILGSLVYQALHVLTIYFIALSLGIDLPLVYFFLFIPVVMVVALIPISLNGLGMREGAWVLLFGQVGLDAATAFSMSILSFLVMSVVSLAGGAFYLYDRGAPEAADRGAPASAKGAGNE